LGINVIIVASNIMSVADVINSIIKLHLDPFNYCNVYQHLAVFSVSYSINGSLGIAMYRS
jgi:hypothetical protein